MIVRVETEGERVFLRVREVYGLNRDVDDQTIVRRAYWSRKGREWLKYADSDYAYYKDTKIAPYLIHAFARIPVRQCWLLLPVPQEL